VATQTAPTPAALLLREAGTAKRFRLVLPAITAAVVLAAPAEFFEGVVAAEFFKALVAALEAAVVPEVVVVVVVVVVATMVQVVVKTYHALVHIVSF